MTGKTPDSTRLSPRFKSFISLLGGRFIQGLCPFTASFPSHLVENARRGVKRLLPYAPWTVLMWKTMQSPGWNEQLLNVKFFLPFDNRFKWARYNAGLDHEKKKCLGLSKVIESRMTNAKSKVLILRSSWVRVVNPKLTLANHKWRRQSNEPIKTWRKHKKVIFRHCLRRQSNENRSVHCLAAICLVHCYKINKTLSCCEEQSSVLYHCTVVL